MGGLTVAYLLFALMWSVTCTTNILAIFDSTSCVVEPNADPSAPIWNAKKIRCGGGNGY
ncbi:hypothetical protein PR001_g22779 [Phytophthora rubi]|uniref:Uncharacterized protein n=1 Tax=Phytophthora rubi TaxID=129364 RepID=A0A6A3IJA7_9STRA|nr:hypothetical protein PR002_g23613 [Phytophthora rubi]KAE8985816.1 hypothetical protein PR001_g22779 [Phytophthora rubi]